MVTSAGCGAWVSPITADIAARHEGRPGWITANGGDAGRGVPHAYLTFDGEQHGFRKAENIKRVLEAELYFYSKVFGFGLADDIQPVQIDNL